MNENATTYRLPPTAYYLLLTACCLLIAGCRPAGPETVPVSGKITFGGGEWPKPGMLYFTPIKPAQGLPSRPGRARFDIDGDFTVTTFDKGDGLIPGAYKVGVECWEVPPQMDSPQAAKSYVPTKYQSPITSGLEVTVEPRQRSVKLRFAVPRQ